MAGPRVAVITSDGKFGTIDRAEAHLIEESGGRILTKSEEASVKAAHDLEEQYKNQSTLQKVAGYAKFAGPAGAIANLAVGGQAAPELEAYREGAFEGATAGLGPAAEKTAREAVGGKAAGQAYVERHDKLAEAHPGLTQAGQAAGMIGGSMAGSYAGPAGAISAAGGLAERGAAKALGGLATKGVLGRAVATGGELAARGAIENSLYNLGQTAGDAWLHDTDLTADKLFAAGGTGLLHGAVGGALLGTAGSLAASGARATGQAARGVLGRVMARGEEAVGEAVAKPGLGSRLESKANELAFDALGATKKQSLDALEHVAGGAEAVGEYVNRQIIKPAARDGGFITGTLRAGSEGRADEMLSAIKADKYGRIAENLSASIKTTPARFSMNELVDEATAIHKEMLSDPTKIAGADSFLNRIKLEASAFLNAGKIAADGTMDAAEAFYARASMERGAYELGNQSGAAKDAYKLLMRKWDARIVDTIDEAAEKAGRSGAKEKILKWKREWQLASAAEEAAQHGADKVLRNNILGLRVGAGAAVGLATGHPLGAAVTAFGGKILQERGAAAGAYALSQIASSQAISKLVARIDGQLDRAAKGLLMPPVKGLLPASIAIPSEHPRGRAEEAMKKVATIQSDPESFAEKVTRSVDGLDSHSPELAAAMAQRQVKAHQFLASKMPVQADRDPLDPHPAPHMTDGQAAEFARYAWYAEKPERFFIEVAHGKLTPEGAETARALMPAAFAELQMRTADALATQMASGKAPPFQQRLVIGQLLGFAAVPSQRPDHMQLLQKNVVVSPETQAAPAPKRSSAKIPTQQSALDRLEAKGPGHR